MKSTEGKKKWLVRLVPSLLVFLVAILSVILLYTVKNNRAIKSRINRQAVANTKTHLNIIAASLQFLVIDYGPYENLQTFMEKIQDEDDKIILIANGYDPNNKRFYDMWGNSLKHKILSPTEYCLISAGPNQIDEQGNGDDIVVHYDPLAELKKYNNLKNQPLLNSTNQDPQ